MKFIFFVSFAFLGLVSCVSFNTGSLETQRFDHNKNFKIVGTISGSSKVDYILGLGGSQSKGSYIHAKENMYKSYILKENQNKINWKLLSQNPSIFKLNYKEMSKKFEPLAKALHPNRIKKIKRKI